MEGKEVVKTPSNNKVLSLIIPAFVLGYGHIKSRHGPCPAQIIQRVLEYGTLDDWRIIYRYYGLDKIVSTCKSMRNLDPKSLGIRLLHIQYEKEQYRCYQNKDNRAQHSSINCELFQIKFSRHFLNRPASIRIVHKSERVVW